MMAIMSRIFKWRDALVNVKPDTLIRWHRKGFRLFWRWKAVPRSWASVRIRFAFLCHSSMIEAETIRHWDQVDLGWRLL
jgi:hypothetical protein